MPKMWRCPKCGRAFVTRNIVHGCGKVPLGEHLRGKPREVVALYRGFVRAVRAAAPRGARLIILPQKTSIGFQARTGFAWVRVLRDALGVALLLPRVVAHPRITNVQSGSPRSYLHHFRVSSPAGLRGEVRGWLREAWRVGLQLHLGEPPAEWSAEMFEELRGRAGAPPKRKERALWRCPRCGKSYVTRNLSHSCRRGSEQEHLDGKSAHVVWLYRRLVQLLREFGPLRINPGRTSISFQARMRFAGVRLGRKGLRVMFLLTRPLEDPRVTRVVAYSPRTFGHQMEVRDAGHFDVQLRNWLAESYRVGQQTHLLARA
jgi:transposase-like protein